MKVVKRLAMVTLVVALVLSLGSCLWFLTLGNKITLGDTEFEPARAIVGELDDLGDQHIVGVFLLGEGVGFTAAEGFSGQGSIVFLVLLSSGSGLVEGEYGFNEMAEAPPALLYGEFAINYNFEDYMDEPDVYGYLDAPDASGSLSIAEVLVGDWLLEWDFVALNGLAEGTLQCAGKYRGEFEVMDLSGMDSAISVLD